MALLLYTNVLFAEDKSDCGILISEFPSEALKKDMSSIPDDTYINICDDIEARVELTVNAGLYSQATSIDNRAYLLALAIDLCNSLPPDYVPEISQELLEEHAKHSMDDGGSGDPIYNPPPKNICINNIKSALTPQQKTIEAKEKSWNRSIKKGRLTPGVIEKKYLRLFPIENIKLDSHGEPASMNPQDIDFANPSYYQVLSEHMEQMRPAIEAGIKPWEAKAFLGLEESVEEQEKKEEPPKVVKTQVEEKPPQVVKAPKAVITEETDSGFKQEYLYIIVGILFLLVVGFVVRSQKSKS